MYKRFFSHLSHKEKKVEKFILGAVLGMAGGALIVANNCKLRNLVKKNQDDLMKKAEQLIDSKLEKLEQMTDSMTGSDSQAN